MNAIIKAPNASSQLSTVTADAWTTLKNSLYPGASDESVGMVVSYCAARGLDPMLKPVHIVPMWNDKLKMMIDVVLPGINLYRTQASRSGTYAGKSEPEYGPDVTENLDGVRVTYPKWCKVTVKRVAGGQICEFTAMEFWKENYATKKRESAAPNAMWAKRPYGQLAKVSEAQALRMAFPELAGDVTSDEMEGKNLAPDVPPARGPQIDITPTPEPWPMLDPSGTERPAKDSRQWVQWCRAAISKLENPEAVVTWRNAMEQHLDALQSRDAEAVEAVRNAAEERMEDLAAAYEGSGE
ncbi:phage recombination protein Bet [Acetobacteraceae bacterium AT-5844]|nr:phage recombination protein Bet [Acetobacteraceae bacterium AT-5844]